MVALSQAIRGKTIGSTKPNYERDRILERAVGECRTVDMNIGGVGVTYLVDTGSNVSTITEGFFREHLSGDDEDLLPTDTWLKITAANGLGYSLPRLHRVGN